LTVVENIFDFVRLTSVEMGLMDNRRMSRAQGGGVAVSGYGARLWYGKATLPVGRSAGQQRGEIAHLQGLQEVGATFLIHSTHTKFLQNDPDGSIAASWNPRFVASTSTQSAEIVLDGIDAGFVFLPGDRLSYNYAVPGGVDTHILHEIAIRSYNSGDATQTLAVRSFAPAGIPNNTPVQFVRPTVRALIVPGSFKPPVETPRARTGGSFDFVEAI
jgi:hypothetical protein